MASIELVDMSRPGFRERVAGRLRIARRYITSLYKSRQERAWFKDIRTYCMFIGHARSGHSILGALLDAHPNVILPDEVDVLRYVAAGFGREQIYHLLLARSQRQASKGRTKGGRDGNTYSYHVPGQWQGRFDRIQVVGDSKAGLSTQRLAQTPELLERLRETMGDARVKIIYVIRNPYDNISTMMLRGGRSFESAIDRYFANCETIVGIRRIVDPADLLLVRQEELINWPKQLLAEICGFLGVEASDDYLSACASILYNSPAKSRYKVEWSSEQIGTVRRNIERFDFLAEYTYER
jgi:hypothetical protein